MKRAFSLCAAALMLTLALPVSALAAETAAVCYPTSVTRSEDGTEMKKIYDLAPEEDPAGIPRSDFEQDGFRYTLTDLLKQELPEHEERQHTETVSLPSKNKDMASVLDLLPQEREFVTDDGLMGTLTLQLDTVRVEVAGYGSSTKEISATRSYPNLAGQDTQYIPKTIEENGKTLTLKDIDWQTDNTATSDGYALGGPFYRGGHLYRLRHQQLRQGLYGNGGLHRDGQPDRPEPDPLCGYLRGHAPPACDSPGGPAPHPIQLGGSPGSLWHCGSGGRGDRSGNLHPAPP